MSGTKVASGTKAMSGMIKHDVKRNIKGNLPIMRVGLCVLLFLIPFSTAALPGDSIFDIAVTHMQMKFRFMGTSFVPAVQIFSVLFGFICGMLSFRFVLDQSKSSAYFALGISRKALYWSRFLVTAVMLLLVVIIPVAVSFLLNILALGIYPGMISAAIYITGGIFVTMMVAYSVAAIGCLLSGTIAEGIFFGAALLAIPYTISYAANTFVKHMLWGNPFGIMPFLGDTPAAPSIIDLLSDFNPVLFFSGDLNIHHMFYRPLETDMPEAISPLVLFIWIAACAIFAALGLLVMRKRRAEQAGFAGMLPAFSRICTFVPLLFLCALAFDLSAGLSMTFGIALLAVIFVLGLHFDGRYFTSANSKKALHIGVRVAILLLFVVGARFGYGSHLTLPSDSDVAQVKVSYAASPNYLGVPALGSSTASSYYFTAKYSYMEEQDVALALKIHDEINSFGKQPLKANENDFESTVVPYDVSFTYTLKNGEEKTWYYDRATFAQLESMLAFESTEPVQQGIEFALSGLSANVGENGEGGNFDAVSAADFAADVWARNAYANGDIVLADASFREMFSLELTAEDRVLLLEAIMKDALAQDEDARYFPDSEPLGILMFSFDLENDIKTFTYHLNNTFVYIDEGFTNTLDFLRDRDLWLEDTFDSVNPDEVETLIVQPYDPYIGINKPSFPQALYFMSYMADSSENFRIQKDFGKADIVKDPEEVKRILSEVRSTYFLSEPGQLVSIKYTGSDRWVYKFCPQ